MTGMKEGAGEDPFAEDDSPSDSMAGEDIDNRRDEGGERTDQVVRVDDDGADDRTLEGGSEEGEIRDGSPEQSTTGADTDAAGASADIAGSNTDTAELDTDTANASANEGQRSVEIPYKLRRNSVQDGRNRVPLFLQGDTKAAERDALRELEERFDDDVSLTDLREALIVAGLGQLDEVEEQLEKWGYGMTFEV